jgi:hypothetical protein
MRELMEYFKIIKYDLDWGPNLKNVLKEERLNEFFNFIWDITSFFRDKEVLEFTKDTLEKFCEDVCSGVENQLERTKEYIEVYTELTKRWKIYTDETT